MRALDLQVTAAACVLSCGWSCSGCFWRSRYADTLCQEGTSVHHSHIITGALHLTPESAHLSHNFRTRQGKQLGPQYFFNWDIRSAVTQPLCFTPRKDPCALCCRGEQVGHLGPRLPHDPPPHAPCRSHKDGQGPPRYHPQPGFLAPAGRPGQCPEAEEECMKEDERGCAVGPLCVRCSADPDAR